MEIKIKKNLIYSHHLAVVLISNFFEGKYKACIYRII